ncbi:MAG: hypothetical protein R3324_11945, partial [Halobacteriales archaeon]|nr:hypothetical protein [Halobacteriales archaeon]
MTNDPHQRHVENPGRTERVPSGGSGAGISRLGRFPARLLAIGALLLLGAGIASPVEAGDFDIRNLIVSDLIVNGNFDSDLSGWTEEENQDLNSYWDPIDVDGSSTSGSFAGVELTHNDEFRPTAWQCVTVVPGDVYYLRFAGREERPSEYSDSAVIELRNVTGEPCPDGGNPPPNSATDFRI